MRNFKDEPYSEKRRVFRFYSTKPEIKAYLDIISSNICNNLISLDKFKKMSKLIRQYISWFLIDGYLALEIIYDKKGEIIEFLILDPISLQYEEELGESYWIQNPDDPDLKRVLKKSQIIYMSYSNDIDDSTSYIEDFIPIYNKILSLEEYNMSQQTNFLEYLEYFKNKLDFISKIPYSILRYEKNTTNDIRYNDFISKIERLFIDSFSEIE